MDKWEVVIQAWPHSTGRGQAEDQQAIGARQQNFEVEAHDMAGALRAAEYIVAGMKTNPMLWQAPIVSIRSLELYGGSPVSNGRGTDDVPFGE